MSRTQQNQQPAGPAASQAPPAQPQVLAPSQHPYGQQQYGGYNLGPSYADTQIYALHQALQIQHAQLQQQADQLRMQHQAIYGVGFGAGIGLPPTIASSLTYPPLGAFPSAGVAPFSLPQYAQQYAYHQHHALSSFLPPPHQQGAAAQPVTGTAQYSAVLGVPPHLQPLQHNHHHQHPDASASGAATTAGNNTSGAVDAGSPSGNRAGASAGAALSLSVDSASNASGYHSHQFTFPAPQSGAQNLSRANLFQMNSMQAARHGGAATTLDVPPPPSTGDETTDPAGAAITNTSSSSPSASRGARHVHVHGVRPSVSSSQTNTSSAARSVPTTTAGNANSDGITTTTSNMMAPTAGATMVSVTTTARRPGDSTLQMPPMFDDSQGSNSGNGTAQPNHNNHHQHLPSVPPNVLPDERRQLVVKFLTQETTEGELKRLFSRLGHVEHVRIICDRATGKTKGYGFVDFEKASDAAAAVKKMRGYPLCGKRLKVSFVSTVRRDAADANARGDFDPDMEDEFDDEKEIEQLMNCQRDEGTQTHGNGHAHHNASMTGSTTRSHIDNSASPSTTSNMGKRGHDSYSSGSGDRAHVTSSSNNGQSGSGASATGSGSGNNNDKSQNSGSNGSSDEAEQRTSPSSADAAEVSSAPMRESGFGISINGSAH